MGTLAGWAYRKQIVIQHTADGAQTNYQMKVSLVKGSGADAAGTIYLGNHCLNWPTDILFTLSDGTTTAGADFWREESDATDGTWWLEANSIPAHPDDFNGYIYYGKIDAADASNGANTFLLYNDCSSLDGWTYTSGVDISAGQIRIISAVGNYKLCTQGSFGDGICVQAKFSVTNLGANYDLAAVGIYKDINNYVVGGRQYVGGQTVRVSRTDGGASDSKSTADSKTSGWIRMCRDGDVAKAGVSSDGITWVETATVTYDNTGEPVGMHCYDSLTCLYDDFIVRNFTTNEPTWAASGAEEVLGSVKKSVPRMARIMVMSP